MNEQLYSDFDLAEKTLKETQSSIVVVKNNVVLLTKKGHGIKPLLETIDELKDTMQGCVVGDRVLGKASALLCVYAKVAGVYTPQATKTAIAVLIRSGIPGQSEELIPFIQNKNKDGLCPFEQLLQTIDKPEEAYTILKQKFSTKR